MGPCLQVKGRRTAHDKEIYMFDGKEVDFKNVRAQELFVERWLVWGFLLAACCSEPSVAGTQTAVRAAAGLACQL